MTSTKTLTRQEIEKSAYNLISQLTDNQIYELMELYKKDYAERMKEADKNGD